jgi:hypothetical protein
MDKIIEIGKFVVGNYETILSAIVAVLTGIIAISLLIPGDQPEKALQAVVDFLKKFSRKPEVK